MAKKPNDPFLSGVTPDRPDMPHRSLAGALVAVSEREHEARGLVLVPQRTRCLCRHEIHELIVTDETGKGPGDTVDRVAYLGFFELTTGGLLIQGDELVIGGTDIGRVIGFDATHMPNHYNIVIEGWTRLTGKDRGLSVEDVVSFRAVWTG